MGIAHRFTPLPPVQVWMDHLADNGPWADDGHLDDQIVKTGGPQTGQAGHLCAAFDLEHTHGVRPLKRLIDGGVICG